MFCRCHQLLFLINVTLDFRNHISAAGHKRTYFKWSVGNRLKTIGQDKRSPMLPSRKNRSSVISLVNKQSRNTVASFVSLGTKHAELSGAQSETFGPCGNRIGGLLIEIKK